MALLLKLIVSVQSSGRMIGAWSILVVICSSGCYSGIHSAARLPMEFAAQPIGNVQALDLSKLARHEFRSDLIYQGDVLELMIATGAEERPPIKSSLRVSQNGTLNVPLVGEVHVAGLDLIGIERVIQQESIRRGVYRSPLVSVLMKQRYTNRVTVVGGVNRPGAYKLPVAGSDLLAAIVAAGGLSKDADTVVEIRQAQMVTPQAGPQDRTAGSGSNQLAGYQRSSEAVFKPVSLSVDLTSIVSGDSVDQDRYRLNDGAVVMVGTRKPRMIQVIGLVKRPIQFELPRNQDVRVLSALALASGRTTQLANKIYVIRQVPDREEPVVIKVSVRKAKRNGRANVLLMDGDVVSVEETPMTFIESIIDEFVGGVGFSARIPGL